MSEEAVPRALADARLTPREREVFWLVVDRLRNREIAERLYIAERTVESHVASVLRKLGGSDRSDLITLGAGLRERLGTEHRLPQVLSSFVGRDLEVAQLSALVAAHRLVTLIGPAGVGKTRLAYQVARSVTGLPSPTLVDLTTVAVEDGVDRAFATALGLVEDDRGLRTSLREALRDDRHWLVVDNCEHVLPEIAVLLGDLLSATAQLRVLATSRSPLRISGEVVYELAPLDLAPGSDDPVAVLRAPAGRLFADRAATALPGFAVTADNAPCVATLCERLDGLPLAIELAAARIRTFSPQELVSHLDRRFELLDAGTLDGTSRHRSLEAALRWSYELLDEHERLVFERCSVFPGEFDYDTAEAVVAFPPLDPDGFARAFPRLVDRSLLSRRRLGDQTTAYRMLETFRAFGRRQLDQHGGAAEVGRRHARHHIQRAIATAVDAQGPDQLTALRWFARRWIDVRAAMRWTLDQGDTERAWTLMAALGRSWDTIGIRGELFEWIDELLARPLPPGALGSRARITAAFLLLYTDPARTVTLASEARDEAPAIDRPLRAAADLAVGWALGYLGDGAAATRHLGSARTQFHALDDPWNEARALQGLGHAAGDLDTLVAYLEEAAQLYSRLGNHVLRANCLTMLAARALEMGAPDGPIEGWITQARRIADRVGTTHERLHAELHAAALAQRRGEHGAVATTYAELLPSLRRIGDHRCASRCLLGMGWAALEEGDTVAARDHLTASAATSDRVKGHRELAAGLRLLARLELQEGRAVHAARLVGAAQVAADRLDPARRNGLPSDEDLVERLTGLLGEEGLRSAVQQGREASPTQLVDPSPTPGC